MTDTNQLPPHTVTINDHPEPHIMQWSDLELAAIKKYAESYALKARAQVHPAQAEVTPEEVMRAAKEATAPEWRDVVDGWHMGLDLMKFTNLILALRPAAVPMTDAAREHFLRGYESAQEDALVCRLPPEGWACTRTAGHEGPCAAVPTDERAFVKRGMDRLREAHHGTTTHAERETP